MIFESGGVNTLGLFFVGMAKQSCVWPVTESSRLSDNFVRE